jgi:hypothetical protein
MPDIDPGIEEIILRAVDRAPRERYATAQEMLRDLEDPSRVVIRDRSERGPPHLLDRIHFPRRILVPGILVLVVGSLFVLILKTGRPSRRPPIPAPTAAEPAGSAHR